MCRNSILVFAFLFLAANIVYFLRLRDPYTGPGSTPNDGGIHTRVVGVPIFDVAGAVAAVVLLKTLFPRRGWDFYVCLVVAAATGAHIGLGVRTVLGPVWETLLFALAFQRLFQSSATVPAVKVN